MGGMEEVAIGHGKFVSAGLALNTNFQSVWGLFIVEQEIDGTKTFLAINTERVFDLMEIHGVGRVETPFTVTDVVTGSCIAK